MVLVCGRLVLLISQKDYELFITDGFFSDTDLHRLTRIFLAGLVVSANAALKTSFLRRDLPASEAI